MTVEDFQFVKRGDILAEIDPANYQSQLLQAQANQAAAAASLANIAIQKRVQRALICQAEATLQGTTADMVRYHFEAVRQRALASGDRLAGTPQRVEQVDANKKRTATQIMLDDAQLDQQRALLDGLDVMETQLTAQFTAARAQAQLAGNNLGCTQIRSAALSSRQARPSRNTSVNALQRVRV
jgi:membrane fusion protein (multidrug efflux system)